MLRFRLYSGGELHVHPEEIRAVRSARFDSAERRQRPEVLVGGRWLRIDMPIIELLATIAAACQAGDEF